MSRIVVLGDLNLDVLVHLPKSLPRGEEERTPVRASPGGSAGTFARLAARQGADVLFVGAVGEDVVGDALVQSLRSAGVTAHVKRAKLPTGTVVSLWGKDERTMLCSRGANDGLDKAWVDGVSFAGADHLHLSGYAVLSDAQRAAARTAMARARAGGITSSLSVPPASLLRDYGPPRFLEDVAESDWLLLNLKEGRVLTGRRKPESVVDALASSHPAGALTLGAEGSLAWRGGERSRRTARPLDLVDTTGAGDAFAAGFVVALLDGRTLDQANSTGSSLAERALLERVSPH